MKYAIFNHGKSYALFSEDITFKRIIEMTGSDRFGYWDTGSSCADSISDGTIIKKLMRGVK